MLVTRYTSIWQNNSLEEALKAKQNNEFTCTVFPLWRRSDVTIRTIYTSCAPVKYAWEWSWKVPNYSVTRYINSNEELYNNIAAFLVGWNFKSEDKKNLLEVCEDKNFEEELTSTTIMGLDEEENELWQLSTFRYITDWKEYKAELISEGKSEDELNELHKNVRGVIVEKDLFYSFDIFDKDDLYNEVWSGDSKELNSLSWKNKKKLKELVNKLSFHCAMYVLLAWLDYNRGEDEDIAVVFLTEEWEDKFSDVIIWDY